MAGVRCNGIMVAPTGLFPRAFPPMFFREGVIGIKTASMVLAFRGGERERNGRAIPIVGTGSTTFERDVVPIFGIMGMSTSVSGRMV